jgi:hypothetical protein
MTTEAQARAMKAYEARKKQQGMIRFHGYIREEDKQLFLELAKKSRERLLETINFEHGEKDDERT